MNIQQFNYVLAVARYQHFETAAEKCFVTQSTLSTMISRLEEELGIQIFDRKKKPVGLTKDGEQLLVQIKKIQKEIEQLKALGQEIKGEVKGNLSIAVIPTIAPFLLPNFLQAFAEKFPELNISVREQTTSEIVRQLKARELDIGILSIPTLDAELVESKLYDESFVYFDAAKEDLKSLKPSEISLENLCLLEEGHCMRTQVLSLCELHQHQVKNFLNFDYKAGSIDSLMRFVKANQASTLLPYLAAYDMQAEDRKHLVEFKAPKPYRTVGIAVHRHFVKHQVLKKLSEEIVKGIKPLLPQLELEGQNLLPV
jgi:LysR family hydrogen peroxide-inducible transcriptional activator